MAPGGLNAAMAIQPHQTLVATPTALEVGVHSGTQGWLKVRAEVGEQGSVTASLAAASPGSEQMLKGQLPALNAYLHGEQMTVTATVAEKVASGTLALTHDGGIGSSSSGTGLAGHDGSLLQRGPDQSGSGQNEGQQSGAASVELRRDQPLRTESSAADTAGPTVPFTALDGSGQWLNVRV